MSWSSTMLTLEQAVQAAVAFVSMATACDSLAARADIAIGRLSLVR
jgi:hypothetical protein